MNIKKIEGERATRKSLGKSVPPLYELPVHLWLPRTDLISQFTSHLTQEFSLFLSFGHTFWHPFMTELLERQTTSRIFFTQSVSPLCISDLNHLLSFPGSLHTPGMKSWNILVKKPIFLWCKTLHSTSYFLSPMWSKVYHKTAKVVKAVLEKINPTYW